MPSDWGSTCLEFVPLKFANLNFLNKVFSKSLALCLCRLSLTPGSSFHNLSVCVDVFLSSSTSIGMPFPLLFVSNKENPRSPAAQTISFLSLFIKTSSKPSKSTLSGCFINHKLINKMRGWSLLVLVFRNRGKSGS